MWMNMSAFIRMADFYTYNINVYVKNEYVHIRCLVPIVQALLSLGLDGAV